MSAMDALKEKKRLEREAMQMFDKVEIPVDDEGFVQAFSLDQAEEYKQFFDTYGFVVVENVLSNDQTDACIDEIWDIVNYNGNVDRNDPNTWHNFPGLASLGLLGRDISYGVASWEARQSENLHSVFANLYGFPELIVSVDRYGFMRPTVGVEFPATDENEAETRDMNSWRTKTAWFHWDMNPWRWLGVADAEPVDDSEYIDSFGGSSSFIWDNPARATNCFITENNERGAHEFDGCEKMQGLISLADSHIDDGGFITVPGFANFLPTFCANAPVAAGKDFVNSTCPEVVEEYAQPITMRRGSLVVWNSKMLHCNYPNRSSNARMCMYVKMFPERAMPQIEGYKASRARALQTALPPDFEPSELGKKVFGMADWC